MATGTGKTIVFAQAVYDAVAKGRRCLVLAHTKELIVQTRQAIIKLTGLSELEVGVEIGPHHSNLGNLVVVASVQSLHKKRLRTFDRDAFGFIVIDEAHHSTAKTYTTIIDWFKKAKRLGVTATPERGDGEALRGMFESVAYMYELIDAVEDHWLVEPHIQIVHDKSLDLSSVSIRAGEYNQGELAQIMEQEPALMFAAGTLHQKCLKETTMGFTVTVKQAAETSRLLNALRPGCSRWIDGTASDDDRLEMKKWITAGPGRTVMNSCLYNEGVDIPAISCVAMLAPTHSKSRYMQRIGRGTRLLGENWEESVANGKTRCVIYDFTGTPGKLPPVTCLDVLDGNQDSRARAKAFEAAIEGPVSVRKALADAAQQVVDEDRRAELESVEYVEHSFRDPFTILGVRPRAGRGGGRSATVAQLDVLDRAAIPGAKAQMRAQMQGQDFNGKKGFIDFFQAQELKAAIARRRADGLPTVKQTRQLRRYGLWPDCSAKLARFAMDKIAAANWRPSPALLQELRSTKGLEFPAEKREEKRSS
jgi:superfamily II DNA or RNA helicase